MAKGLVGGRLCKGLTKHGQQQGQWLEVTPFGGRERRFNLMVSGNDHLVCSPQPRDGLGDRAGLPCQPGSPGREPVCQLSVGKALPGVLPSGRPVGDRRIPRRQTCSTAC